MKIPVGILEVDHCSIIVCSLQVLQKYPFDFCVMSSFYCYSWYVVAVPRSIDLLKLNQRSVPKYYASLCFWQEGEMEQKTNGRRDVAASSIFNLPARPNI